MNKLAYFVLTLLIIGSGCASSADRPTNARLRYDGIYRSPAKKHFDYLRFYGDGTVLSVGTTGRPEQIRKWFSRGHSNSSVGVYKIQGNQLSFSTTSEAGTVDYKGKIVGEQLHLNSFSHINKHRGKYRYVFLKW